MKPQNLDRHLAMTLVALLYGANYSMIKVVTPAYLLPFGFLVLRVLIAGIIFWLLDLGSTEKIDLRKDGFRIILSAFFGAGINMMLFFKGVSLTTAINGSIIMTLTPIMVFVMSLLILKEPIRRIKIIGLLIGLVGAIFIIYSSGSTGYKGNWLGDLLIFLNAMAYGAYLVVVKPLLTRYKPLTIAKWIFVFGFVMIVPFGIDELMIVNWSSLHAGVYWSMAYSIVGVTVIVYILNIWAMKKVSPSTVGVYIYLQPVFATFIASLFFEEKMSLVHVLSAILVFVGVGLVIKPSKITN